MAKRSYIKAIKMKQSGPYAGVAKSPAAIHAIQQLKSFPESGFNGLAADAQAERTMKQGWSITHNPICSDCHVQKSLNGSCNC